MLIIFAVIEKIAEARDLRAPNRAELLVIEGDASLRDAISASLGFSGFSVTPADTGRRALRLSQERPFDLIVIDVTLPDLDGFAVVRQMDRDAVRVPVIFLLASDTQPSQVAGLSVGGDDFIVKPFGLDELDFRVRTVLRRTNSGASASTLTFADIELDQDTYEVRRNGHPLDLSPTEFRLLRYLMLNQDRVLTRRELLDHVWDYDFSGPTNVVVTYIGYLRRKLGAHGPDVIHTQRSVGYRLRRPRNDHVPQAAA